MQRKLNLGCGKDIREGYINLDIYPREGVDIIHNLNQIPYPFPDNYFDEVLCRRILEALNDLPKVIEELYRISKPNAKWICDVPYWHSSAIAKCKNLFNVDSFNLFLDYYPIKCNFKINKVELVPSRWGKLIPPIKIPNKKLIRVNDLRHLMSYIFGEIILRIIFEIEIIKN